MASDETKREIAAVLRRMFADDRISTHYPDCWQNHRGCAVLFAADLLDPDGRNDG